MATYRFSAKLISRSSGRSATAAAAYRSGERIIDERTGEIFNYSRRSDVLDCIVLAPVNAPEWIYNRAALWNAVEQSEKRKDAQVAREIQVSLPHELPLSANRELLYAFVNERFVSRGMVADVAIHAAHAGGDERNVHAHILLTTRGICEDGFGPKEREWNERSLISTWRLSWEQHVNEALRRAHREARVDHRSYADRGIDLEPEPKQGAVATKMERMGLRSHAGEDRRAARDRNTQRTSLRQYRKMLDEEIVANMPVMAPSAALRWRKWREQILSEQYVSDMRGSSLARYWHIDQSRTGISFRNSHGHLLDTGGRVVASRGNAFEIDGMIALAKAKGWTSVTFSGVESFRRNAIAAAVRNGLEIEPEQRDAHYVRQLLGSREAMRETLPHGMRSGTRTRGRQM